MIRLGDGFSNTGLQHYSLDHLAKSRGEQDTTTISIKKNVSFPFERSVSELHCPSKNELKPPLFIC